MFRLRLLGAIDLRDDQGREIRSVLAQPKRLALIAYLAAASPRGAHRRDLLHGVLWPELDQEHARNALNKAVYFLRQSLGEGTLVSRSPDQLALDETALWVDVSAFKTALDQGRPSEALALYQGDFLPSFFISDASGFEAWLEQERADLRSLAADAARLQGESCLGSGRFDEAINCAHRAVALSNGDERPLRRLIELLDHLGDRAAAIHAYDRFAQQLAADFQAEPAAETVALIERIRASPPTRSAPNPGSSPQAGSRLPIGPAEGDTVRRQVSPRRWRFPILASAIASLGLLVGVALRSLGPRHPPALDPNLLAVAPFEVMDPALELWSEGIVDILSRDLDGAGPLRTVSPAVVIQRWRGRAESGAARELGRRTGAGLVVFGYVMGSGPDSVRVRATLVDGTVDRTLGEVEVRAAALHLDKLLESLTLKLLQELGRERPVGAVRQGSISARPLPALKAFLQGERFYRRMLWDSAAWHYDHAIALDSAFALAHYRMAMAVAWASERSNRYRPPEDYARRAAMLNRGQTTRDSLLLVGGPFGMLLDPADPEFFARYREDLVALERASRLYPGDPEVWYMLGEARNHVHFTDVKLAEILEAFDHAIELDSTFGPAYKHTVELAMRLGDTDRARKYAAAYLASTSTGVSIPSLRIDGLLLDPVRAGSREAASLIDTVAGVELWMSWADLAQWPDSGETSVRLARALLRPGRSFVGTPSVVADSINRRKILARMLAFRGHLREAARTAPPYSFRWPLVWLHPFPELALLGVVPADSATVVFGRMLRGDSLLTADGEQRHSLSWWNASRDTASLALFARRADSSALRHPNPVEQARLRALGDAARAYLALVQGDSAAALHAFAALPDSLCVDPLPNCFFEKLTHFRLAAALGQDSNAAEIFDHWIQGRHLSPIGVLGNLERGRIAERLGQRDRAVESYRFVADVWRNADPQLQTYVAEAHERMRRAARH